MNYSDFITYVTTALSGTTVGGSTKSLYIKHCLQDEIELETLSQRYDFYIYLTPMPTTILNENQVQYQIQVYVTTGVGLAPMVGSGPISDRFVGYTNVLNFFQAFIQQIDQCDFPIVGTPILLWDNNVDGFYFDLTITTSNECV